MKKMINLGLVLLAFATAPAHAQEHGPKLAGLDIHTNAVCGDCKHRIETEMLYVKGVRGVMVDLDREVIHVDYQPKKTDPDKLREAVSKIGYLADDVQPDRKARKELPDCCQMTKDEHDGALPAPQVPEHAPEARPEVPTNTDND